LGKNIGKTLKLRAIYDCENYGFRKILGPVILPFKFDKITSYYFFFRVGSE
jgi:hypothetical protein